ncbi:hypothetical protein B0H17DRAFT_666021 [Mycena rosella]|uniref:Uncharacterized protein n=1 Tax=Mycena rosella TaxID=1033263 RepID=A0AAD7M886_MYCRO|nr:hypothetical protein B0H17DRAFT_666021 [Mycena rosella]
MPGETVIIHPRLVALNVPSKTATRGSVVYFANTSRIPSLGSLALSTWTATHSGCASSDRVKRPVPAPIPSKHARAGRRDGAAQMRERLRLILRARSRQHQLLRIGRIAQQRTCYTGCSATWLHSERLKRVEARLPLASLYLCKNADPSPTPT